MAITQKQIADAVGVSHGAVSQVLHGSRQARISPQKQQEIREMARIMGYRPRTLTTYTVGYVMTVDELRLLGETNFLINVEAALRRHGYRLVLVEDNGDSARMRDLLNVKTVDGVLLVRWQNGHIRDVLPPQVPWVLTSTEEAPAEGTDRVTVDLYATTRKVVEHLAEYGHRRICLATGYLEVPFHAQQWQAVCATCDELGPQMRPVVSTSLDVEMETALLDLMRSEDPPTAIIAGSPEKAVITLNLLHRAGYNLPEDVSLVSLFDLPIFESLRPLITSTDAMGAHIAEQAVARLIEKIEDPTSPARQVRVSGKLIHRDSVAPPLSLPVG